MRRQLCTSSAPSNWTLAASAPGPSWAMNTWKWRTLQPPSRHTGQNSSFLWWMFKCVVLSDFTLTSSIEDSYLLVLLMWTLFPCWSFFFSIRHAIEVNKRDYRAWYGLGQTYEILKMPFYCLYYYRKAHQLRYEEKQCVTKNGNYWKQNVFKHTRLVNRLVIIGFDVFLFRPNDSRMLVALGESYEKLSQQVEAKKVCILQLSEIPALCYRFPKVSGSFQIWHVLFLFS